MKKLWKIVLMVTALGLVVAGVGAISTSSVAGVVYRPLDMPPLCGSSRIQIPRANGLQWMQVGECGGGE